MKKEINGKKIFLGTVLGSSLYPIGQLYSFSTIEGNVSGLLKNKMFGGVYLINFVVFFLALLFHNIREEGSEKNKDIGKKIIWSLPILYLLYLTISMFPKSPIIAIFLLPFLIIISNKVGKEVFVKKNKKIINQEEVGLVDVKTQVQKLNITSIEKGMTQENEKQEILGKKFFIVKSMFLIPIKYLFILVIINPLAGIFIPMYITRLIIPIILILISYNFIKNDNIIGYLIIFITTVVVTIEVFAKEGVIFTSNIIFIISILLSGYNIYKLILWHQYKKLKEKREHGKRN